jgi:hypothetical protein
MHRVGRAGWALTAGSRTAWPLPFSTWPELISAFSRSRDKVGTSVASARSRRQPAWSTETVVLMIDTRLSVAPFMCAL